ncbi:alpha/beta hydrolase [Myxococcus qinghaiensis]|uniref:alpha/beta hydrolase n=1 Tax=Myxococcus qinghaiensis TaxID=2906758 RepID=UPI0020A817A3|nr:alpha/beta hydrolase [Myxococcus qinghaiensis]MCP3165230.1 alpha/beta hydrolase [Myxococcus qinghaiensis]
MPTCVPRGFLRALALGLLGLTLVSCNRGGASAAETPRIALKPCRLEGLAPQAQCGTYEVFEDRVAKSGRKLSLRVVVVPALAAQPQPDPLVLLAGGPGQAASRMAFILPAVERIRRHRDILLVDQRGTGDSHPLDCDPGGEDLSAAFDDSQSLPQMKKCLGGWDADVRQYTTPVAMDDLDEVRAALGYEKLNLWGISYGTRAALVYMRQHPERVRTAILDGVAPMSMYLPLYMPRDGQLAVDLLLAHCEQDAACAKAYPELRARTEALLSKLETPRPIRVVHPLTGAPEEFVLSRQAFLGVLRSQLYNANAASLVPLMLDRASRDDWGAFTAVAMGLLKDMRRGMSHGLYFAVTCAEDAPFFDRAKVEAEAKGTWFGADVGLQTLSLCQDWPRATLPAGYREPVVSDVPTLLLSGELDPVTPPSWAEDAKRTLSRSLHVVVPGVGHNTLGADCSLSLMQQLVASGAVEGLKPACGANLTRPPVFTSFAGPVP